MHHQPENHLDEAVSGLLMISEVLPPGSGQPGDALELGFEDRRKSRQRVRLSSGREAGLRLARGMTLAPGALLKAEDGTLIELKAACEELSEAACPDSLLLARAAYHLGNRHLAVRIEPGRLSYLADDLADAMLRGLGLTPERVCAPFEPEPGAALAAQAHKH